MPESGSRSALTLLRVVIDDIHRIRTSLRRCIKKYQYLRLAVVMEERSLLPYVTPKEVENGELDFDRQVLLPLKENLKYVFFHLYDVGSTQLGPHILASGRLSVRDIVSDNSIWTLPLTKNGYPVCKIAFFTEILAPTEQTEEWLYYAPRFTSPVKEAAMAVRRVTHPARQLCQSVVVQTVAFPLRTSCFLASVLHHLLHTLFPKAFDDPI